MVIVNSPTVDQAQSEAKRLHKEIKQVDNENSISQGNFYFIKLYIKRKTIYSIVLLHSAVLSDYHKKTGEALKIKF